MQDALTLNEEQHRLALLLRQRVHVPTNSKVLLVFLGQRAVAIEEEDRFCDALPESSCADTT